jgi:spore maturation protein CgeB
MKAWKRYLSDSFYWRRAVLRLSERAGRRVHLETCLDRVLAESARLPRSLGDPEKGRQSAAGLRLLYVAPTYDYGNLARGYSYEENHFLPALAVLGFDLARFDSLTLLRRFGRKLASDLLVELAFRLRPDAALFVLFKDDFEESAVEELRRLGCVTLNWFADDHWRFDAFSSRWAPKFSWVITTDPAAPAKYRAHGVTNVIRSQWGVNHRLYRPLDRPRRLDVSFIGQPHGNRRAVLRELRAAGIAVEAWGYGWPRGKLSTRRAVEIINESAVNLNLSNATMPGVEQIKGRDFEVPACRGLLMTHGVEALGEYYEPQTEVVVYDGLEDLKSRIRWVLDNPVEADKIREAGYRRVLRDHTYERRFLEIFRQAGVLS